MNYTFFWKDGKRETLKGSSPASAMNNAGYGAGSLSALDFYESGVGKNWEWNNDTSAWEIKK